MKWIWALGLLVGLAQIAIRLWPLPPDRWHVAVVAGGDGAVLCRDLGPAGRGLEVLVKVAQGWPRTRVLAGSVAEDRISFVSRSLFWGFPDITTLEIRDGQVCVHARQVFGRGDWGVNAARLSAWFARAYGPDLDQPAAPGG